MWWKIVMTLKFSKFFVAIEWVYMSKKETQKQSKETKKKKKQKPHWISNTLYDSDWNGKCFGLSVCNFWLCQSEDDCSEPFWTLKTSILRKIDYTFDQFRFHSAIITFKPIAFCLQSLFYRLSLCVVGVISFSSSSKWAHCFDYLHSS